MTIAASVLGYFLFIKIVCSLFVFTDFDDEDWDC